MKKSRGSRKSNPIAVEAERAQRVFFGDKKMAHIASLSFNAARFIPAAIKARLEARGSWEDVTNSIYVAAIQFYRDHAGKNFNPSGNKEHYKKLVRFIWRELYAALRTLIPDYKRRYYEKFMSPAAFNNVHEIDATGKPFAKEHDLASAEASAEA